MTKSVYDTVDNRVYQLFCKYAGEQITEALDRANQYVREGKEPERALADALDDIVFKPKKKAKS